MSDMIGNIAWLAVFVVALIGLYLVYRRRQLRAKRLTGDLLDEYFRSGMPSDQVGQRTREIASRHFIASNEFYSLVTAAFQRAAAAKLGQQTHSVPEERNLLKLLADLKTEFGLTDRYRIEGWRAGRE
jgi:hypothetical protein